MIVPRWLVAFLLCLGSLQGADSRLREDYFRQLQVNPAQTEIQDRLIGLLQKSKEEAAFFQSQPADESTEVVRGYLWLRQKQFTEARVAFERAAKRGTTIWPWRGLAAVASAENQPEKAAQALEKALEKASSVELLEGIAEQWHQAGQSEKARRYWQQALAAEPDNRELRRRLARQFTELGETELARQQWQSLADSTSGEERLEALRELAYRHEQLAQFAEAVQTLERAAAELSPTSWQRAPLDQDLLRLHRLAGTLDQLAAQWQNAHEKNPQQALAALRLADLFAERENFAEQRATLRRSHLANPDSLELLKALAEAESASGSPEQALGYLVTLARRQPGKTEWRYRQAELLIRLERVPEAVTLLNSLRQTHSKDPGKLAELRTFLEHHRLADPLIELLRQLAATHPNEIPELIEQQLRWGRSPDSVDLAALPLSIEQRVELAHDLSERFQRHQNLPTATEWARQASRLDPKNIPATLRVADLLPREMAAEWLEEWIAARGLPLPPEEVDQRLYRLTAKETQGPEAQSPVQSSLDLLGMLPTSASEPLPPPAPLLRMMAVQAAHPHPEGAQRLARWHRWRHDLPAAAATLQLAIEAFPQSHELKSELARVTADRGDFPTAIRIMEQLRKDDPNQALRYDRQIALFELRRGEFSAALDRFQKRVDENPRSSEAWQDLAIAQGESDNWFDSLESWLRAAALATPSERYEMRVPILQITQRLGLPARGQAYLRALSGETPDDRQKNALQEELAASLHLSGESTRISPPPAGAKTPTKAPPPARVRAYFREPTNLDAWLEVVRSTPDESRPDIWEEIVARFPRDPRALRLAADYYSQQGQLSITARLLSRELELGEANARKHLAAGKLHLHLGDRLAALHHLEKAWYLTQAPLEPGKPFPLHSFGGPPLAASSDPATNLRREMIQEISQLVRSGNAKTVWLPRWQTLTDPAEKITGLLAIGETAAALDDLARLLTEQPENLEIAKSFFSQCVGEERFDLAFAQLQNHPEHFAEWQEVFLLTLTEKLNARPGSDLSALLTQAARPTLTGQALLWPLAKGLAHHQRFIEATTLGRLALESPSVPDRSATALKLADWYLAAGNWEAATDTLRLAQTDEAGNFTHPALIAARLEWLLASPQEQKQLLDTARVQSDSPQSPPQLAARYALFAALAQNRTELPRAMDRLIQAQRWSGIPEDATSPFAQFVQTSSGALRHWGLPDAAAELLARVVDSDPVLLRLRSPAATAQREKWRLDLLGTRLLAQPPTRRMDLLDDLLAENSLPLESLMAFGDFFEQAGSSPTAYRCYELATQRFGLNDALLAARLRTARNGVDSLAWIETCRLAARSPSPLPSEMRLAVASQLALIATAEGRNSEAETLLRKTLADFPENEIILRQTAEYYLKQSNSRTALSLLTASRIPMSAPLAMLQMQAALALGEDSKAIDLFKTHPPFARELFPALLAHFSSPERIETLAEAVQSDLKHPAHQFSLWEEIALQSTPERREQAREALRKLVRADPGLAGAEYVFRKRLARQSGQVNEFIQELQEEWQHGQYFAGEILIQLLAEEKRVSELDAILSEFIQHATVNENTLGQLARFLDTALLWDQSARVYAVLEARRPGLVGYRLGRARALTKAGREAETVQTLAELQRARHVLPSAMRGLAHYYLTIDQPQTARLYFSEMKTHSSALEQSVAYLGLAQCAMELRDWDDAETQLREAAALDLSPQIARLAAEWVKADSPGKLTARLKQLGLTPPLERATREQLQQILPNAPLPSSP